MPHPPGCWPQATSPVAGFRGQTEDKERERAGRRAQAVEELGATPRALLTTRSQGRTLTHLLEEARQPLSICQPLPPLGQSSREFSQLGLQGQKVGPKGTQFSCFPASQWLQKLLPLPDLLLETQTGLSG